MGPPTRAIVVIAAAAAIIGLSACGGKKEPAPAADEATAAACEQTSDCPTGNVCLAGACADARIHQLPSNAVTPDKVKREVEEIGKRADERNQKALDL